MFCGIPAAGGESFPTRRNPYSVTDPCSLITGVFCTRKENRTTKEGLNHISQAKSKYFVSRRKLTKELEEYEKKGISLYLEGRRSSPDRIARACQLAEDGAYMRDYTVDADGNVARVDFDYILEDPRH